MMTLRRQLEIDASARGEDYSNYLTQGLTSAHMRDLHEPMRGQWSQRTATCEN